VVTGATEDEVNDTIALRLAALDSEAVVPDDPTQRGRWDSVFALPDVAIHTHVLPTGKVLFWGRRKDPKGSMHQQGCAPFVWNPGTTRQRPPANRSAPMVRRSTSSAPATRFSPTVAAAGRGRPHN